MGLELVILADREATLEEWSDCASQIVGDCLVRGYVSGVRQFLDTEGQGIISYWPARLLDNPRTAVGMAGSCANAWRVWIDVAVRFGSEDSGVRLAVEMARRLGGELIEV